MSQSTNRALKLVKKATAGEEGTPDWTTILEILNDLESSPQSVRLYLQAIHSVLSTGSHATRMNSLVLIDALFKNCTKEQLPELQSSSLFRALNVPGISDDPDLHNFLSTSVPEWVSNCTEQHCLAPSLTTYQQTACKEIFVPKLTPAILAKLRHDFATAYEVLELMTQCVLRGARNGFNSDVIAEILPNVREIGKRAGELEQIIHEPPIHAVVAALQQLSLVCEQALSDVKAGKVFDQGKIIELLTDAQRALQSSSKTDTKRSQLRRRRAGEDEMSVETFFERFDSLKRNRDFQSSADSLIGSLIDLS
jgi:hypothetical protein